MTVELVPYLRFRGDAREAMEHYRSVLGGKLELTTFRDGGAGLQPGVEESELDRVLHARLVTAEGLVLMGSDAPRSHDDGSPGGHAVVLQGDDDARLRACFDGLSAGGTVGRPLAPMPAGDVFGMVTDRFGVDWMVSISAVVPAVV